MPLMAATHTQHLPDVLVADAGTTQEEHRLVLFNDDHNTFEWVIESLVAVCDHTHEQAEQCAWFVHTKGKYAVKHGSEDYLLPRKRALLDRGLTAEVH